jgi:hypothetical protein
MQELSFFQPTSPPFLGILLSFIVHPVLDNSLLAKFVYFQIQKPASLCCCVFSLIPARILPRKSPAHLFWWGRFQTLAPSLRSNQKVQNRVLVATGLDPTQPAIFSCNQRLGLSPVAGCAYCNAPTLEPSSIGCICAWRLQSTPNFKLDQDSDRRDRHPIRSSISDPNFPTQRSVETATNPGQTLQAICPGSSLVG